MAMWYSNQVGKIGKNVGLNYYEYLIGGVLSIAVRALSSFHYR